jgi:Ser/Thr protein kinase RdoA (MazF antagonist)
MFEWLPGDTLTKDAPIERYEELGTIYGQIHELDDEGNFEKARAYFDKCVNYLLKNGIIDANTKNKLFTLYEHKSTKAKHKVVMEYTDLHLGNVMVNPRTNRLVFIDEEGLNHKIKGFGLTKAIVHLFTEPQREAFLKGYGKAHDTSYFDKDYEDFLLLYLLTRDVYVNAHNGKEYGKHLQKLMQYLSKQ